MREVTEDCGEGNILFKGLKSASLEFFIPSGQSEPQHTLGSVTFSCLRPLETQQQAQVISLLVLGVPHHTPRALQG